ncbi:hypothetical protein DPMN_073501 [Dreissena polymorpha]|uniref:Uncharacterized protein n=1 Tax=Dreissena polymorpha TaxID=45954 RepID=A0A9D4BZA9_DREPO|nr:hypothetical protein DPMN_073501 [Dreissena polymorpha]
MTSGTRLYKVLMGNEFYLRPRCVSREFERVSRRPYFCRSEGDFRAVFNPGSVCKKTHENWARFTEKVHEVVPLGVLMQRLRIAGNRHSSEDVSRVVLNDVSEGSKCASETSNMSSTPDQEGAKNLIRISSMQISDGESGPAISNIGVAARDSGWYNINNINPSGDLEVHEEAFEARIELVMAGEEYEILGVTVDDTGGPKEEEDVDEREVQPTEEEED